jgi:hypothetical protein
MHLHKKINRRIFTFLLICTLTASFAIAYASGIIDTKHNLSVSGPGNVASSQETQICIFCHTPHNANPAYPLWNHEHSEVQTYKTYWSNTLQSYSESESRVWKVDGFSKLCLGCHDGTVALGAVQNRADDIDTVPDIMSLGMIGYIGTDLSGTHPVSIVFDIALKGKRDEAQKDYPIKFMPLNSPPRMLGSCDNKGVRSKEGDREVFLYPTQGCQPGVQCTSCHDPHGGVGGSGAPPFWRKPTHDEVCEVCHDIEA